MAAITHCTVYTRQGNIEELAHVRTDSEESRLQRKPTIADRIPITKVMARELVCARPDLRVDALAALMIDKHIGCIPVIDERGRPHGIVTKFDLVEQLDRFAREDTTSLTASDIMMPLAITLDENATVAHAAAIMTLEDLHHVMIVGGSGTLLGVVSSKDIVRWLVENDRLA